MVYAVAYELIGRVAIARSEAILKVIDALAAQHTVRRLGWWGVTIPLWKLISIINKVKMMDMMISIPKQVADKLRVRARASGQPLPAYASKIVESAVQGPTLEELLAPVQADFARSGMTEKQLLSMGRKLLHKVRAEKSR